MACHCRYNTGTNTGNKNYFYIHETKINGSARFHDRSTIPYTRMNELGEENQHSSSPSTGPTHAENGMEGGKLLQDVLASSTSNNRTVYFGTIYLV